MKLQSHTYDSRREKVIDFIIGIVGWHVVNGLLLLLVVLPSSLSTGGSSASTLTGALALLSLCASVLALVFNLGGLIYFGGTRSWIAVGMLAAMAFAFVIGLIAAAFFLLVACFNPSAI